jgi:hypothetical protein
MSEGYASWPDSGGVAVFSEPIYLNGTVLQGSAFRVPMDMDVEPSSVTLPTLGMTDVEQLAWHGGDIPVSMARRKMTLPIQIRYEADYWAIQEAVDVGQAVSIWVDWAFTDKWYIPGNDLGTSWKFSRQLPYNLVPTIDQASRPPKAWFEEYDGTLTALTVVTGTPTTGQVKILDASGFQSATTFAGDADATTYKFLKIRYHPMLLVKLVRFQFSNREHNSLVYNLEALEHRGGLYTLAPGELP